MSYNDVVYAPARPTVRYKRLTPFEMRRSRPEDKTRPEGIPTYAKMLKDRRRDQLKILHTKLLERSWSLSRVQGGPSAVNAHLKEKYLCRMDKVIAKIGRRIR